MSSTPQRRSKLLSLASRAMPSNSRYSERLSSAPNSPSIPTDITLRPPSPAGSTSGDALAPPSMPFANRAEGNGLSSRRSSVSSKGTLEAGSIRGGRPNSLSVNYVPAKFTKLHAPGDWAHRRAKIGGGRDAFAKDAQRMGKMGTVDDDEGVVFQLGKGGLKKKKPKLRWNRFKWILFGANGVLICYGLATLVSAILVWLNVFYQSDVIRVGNHTELILSTVAAAFIVLTSLIGYAGILLNNRAFLAVYTLLLWVCLALIVAPGYMTYKQRTFNLEGKINSQWSRELGSDGRLRIQDALRCCGYFSPYVEATVSPLCYPRSISPGCKNRYLKLERTVLETWYTISFSLVPAQILIIVAALLCSNHITYRFGKGLTPKRYRLDLGSMAVIMDEYASQIAAQYGPGVAEQVKNRSSVMLQDLSASPFNDPVDPNSTINSNSNRRSNSPRPSVTASTSGLSPALTKVNSRLAPSLTGSTGYNRSSGLYDPSKEGFETTSSQGPAAGIRGSALFDPGRDSFDSSVRARDVEMERYEDADADADMSLEREEGLDQAQHQQLYGYGHGHGHSGSRESMGIGRAQ
ncbi:hypothetical protein EHS25_008585 [Saitozyma podzolica]|uniref:Tetraspanin Tsp2 n=1 Tax=Saitozyma podzolica TaxID=1890683 RepID=A0A427YM85_9TREE|nr:hypothetical protein EHS25_008585 [Saitozyma podzolica]